MGDLNELSSPHEKLSTYKEIHPYTKFNTSMNTNCLTGICYLGFLFTWFNKREANNVIFVTLDRALANVHLLKFYPTAF